MEPRMTRTLKESLHDLLAGSPIRMKVIAERLGISYSYLANAGNPDLEDFQFQLRHLIPLVKLVNDYSVLDYIEAACGRVAVTIPPSSGDIRAASAELFSTINKFGTLAQDSAKALEDGVISKSERRDIEDDAIRLVSQVMAFVSAIQGSKK